MSDVSSPTSTPPRVASPRASSTTPRRRRSRSLTSRQQRAAIRAALAARAERVERANASAVDAHLARHALSTTSSWSNSSLGNGSAAFTSRCEYFERQSLYLRGMGDPGSNNDPFAHLTISHAAAAARSFSRSASAGAGSFAHSTVPRQAIGGPGSSRFTPGPAAHGDLNDPRRTFALHSSSTAEYLQRSTSGMRVCARV